MIRKVNPKNQRVRRALESRAPKLVENTKKSLVLQGPAVSAVVKVSGRKRERHRPAEKRPRC